LKNIFVGNLDFNTSEQELRQLFEAYGQVDRVSIMTDRDTGRSRGFGFVEMANAEDGEKAIAALNGSQMGGRKLNVNEARPRPERTGGGRDRGGRGGGRGRWWRSAALSSVAYFAGLHTRDPVELHDRILRRNMPTWIAVTKVSDVD
jgi:cold-inducible RNA-binding protein